MHLKKIISYLMPVVCAGVFVSTAAAQLPPGVQPAKRLGADESNPPPATSSPAAPAPASMQAIRATGETPAPASSRSLKVGDAAPSLKVGKWLKGEPVDAFQRGMVYVVEFWATWCGPCIENIPHLTELAHRYKGRAEIIGVSINEVRNPMDTSYYAKVEKFVQKMGDKMDYHVAVDGKDRLVAKNWFEASGETGIPVAYVVDQQGKIAWIGHPGGELDQVIEQVIGGNYSGAEAAKRHEEQRAKMEKAMALRRPLFEALKNRDFDKVLAAIEASTAAFPEQADNNIQFKLPALAEKFGDATAYAYAKSVHAGTAPEVKEVPDFRRPWIHYILAAVIMDEETNLQVRDYDLALEYAQIAVSSQDSKEQVLFMPVLAEAYFRRGDTLKAAEIAGEAAEKLKVTSGIQQEIKDRMLQELAKYNRT